MNFSSETLVGIFIAAWLIVGWGALLMRPRLLAPRCNICGEAMEEIETPRRIWKIAGLAIGRQKLGCTFCLNQRQVFVVYGEKT